VEVVGASYEVVVVDFGAMEVDCCGVGGPYGVDAMGVVVDLVGAYHTLQHKNEI
jgi:hypothetical protein